MSIKESHCTRKKMDKIYFTTTLTFLSLNLILSSCHPTPIKKKKKCNAWKNQYLRGKKFFESLRRTALETPWLSAVCLPIHAPPAVNTHTVSYLLLLLCFVLKFEAVPKKKKKIRRYGLCLILWFLGDGMSLKSEDNEDWRENWREERTEVWGWREKLE